MERTYIQDTIKKINQPVLIKGWVTSVRQHGGVNFLDIRDWTGTVQAVLRPQDIESESPMPSEWDVVAVTGEVSRRPPQMVNPNLATGGIELKVQKIEIISKSKPSPIPLETKGYEISEEKRLKYRYLDLRRPRLQANLKKRQEVKNAVIQFLTSRNFLEVTTPLLTKSTPEGARDFVVPSRLHPGKFYALPQSPQQYKQLLMVSGIEKYFQFPQVFRDEDLRADRLFEHTQLDLEMAFASQEQILELVEELVVFVTEKVLHKKIKQKPFPRLSYGQAMKEYQQDNPDLRSEQEKQDPDLMAYVWITEFPMFEKLEDGSLSAVHHPFTKINPKSIFSQEEEAQNNEELFQFLEKNKNKPYEILKLKAHQYDLVLNGAEVAGGSLREYRPEILQKVFEVLGHSEKEIKQKFGHLLEAFTYGVPPHGGIAFGFDRWLATLLQEPSIREVVAFPTTGQGKTAVMDAPSEISSLQLKELHLQITKPQK